MTEIEFPVRELSPVLWIANPKFARNANGHRGFSSGFRFYSQNRWRGMNIVSSLKNKFEEMTSSPER